ncbi:MAG: ArsA family ATPase [Deltaproteobacteria bacterium]|nr:ArsA family ATPase [Deltaproteobacteria bacterium]MBW2253064.1 ArsA family ATPase [Deltaproteobacteria bacterium]
MDLNRWLQDIHLVVCVGSGGVGKTTTAATFGLWGALHGRKAMVLTIDPAKRLANSLGLSRFEQEGVRIDLSPLGEARGELWAMMLDSRATFDDLIGRIAPTEEMRDRIFRNGFYQHMSEAFAGTQDYMATEKIYDIVASEQYDLVVLDTPPVKNALDFLESPGRVVNFFDERVMSWFLPKDNGGVLGGLFAGTSAVVLRLLAAVFGREFVEEMTELMRDFEELYEGFRKRHDEVLQMFRAEDTAFVTLCAPTESSIDVAEYFQEELTRRGLPRGGVIVNQVHRCDGSTHDADAVLGPVTRELGEDLGSATVSSVLARLGMAHRRLHEIATSEQALVEQVHRAAAGSGYYQEVPRLDTEVNDLPTLYQVGRHLFLEPAEEMG